VVFADSIKNALLYPARDEDWHKVTDFNHLHKDYFNEGRYHDHYLPLVERLVQEFRGHSGVGMWQLMNEPAIYPDPASDADVLGFGRFVDEVSARIYELDKAHPISIGLINIAHIMPPGKDLNQFAADFYAQRRFIHIVSCHSYQSLMNADPAAAWDHEDNADADIRAAAQTGRAAFWTEFGASQVSDRKLSTERFLNRHLRDQRASGALQWGFMIGPNAIPDKGVGDKDFGFSNAPFNAQFEELKQLFTHFVAGLD
jgi:endo-1,4-beta-mannosidase